MNEKFSSHNEPPEGERILATPRTKENILRRIEQLLLPSRAISTNSLGTEAHFIFKSFSLSDGREMTLFIDTDYGDKNAIIHHDTKKARCSVSIRRYSTPSQPITTQEVYELTWGGNLNKFINKQDDRSLQGDFYEHTSDDGTLDVEGLTNRWLNDSSFDRSKEAAKAMGVAAMTEAEALDLLEILNGRMRAL